MSDGEGTVDRKTGAQVAAEALVAGTAAAEADVLAALREVTRVTREIAGRRPMPESRSAAVSDFPPTWFATQRDQSRSAGRSG